METSDEAPVTRLLWTGGWDSQLPGLVVAMNRQLHVLDVSRGAEPGQPFVLAADKGEPEALLEVAGDGRVRSDLGERAALRCLQSLYLYDSGGAGGTPGCISSRVRCIAACGVS
jgi:hypothetical protein